MTALVTFLAVVLGPVGVTWAVLRLFRSLSDRSAGRQRSARPHRDPDRDRNTKRRVAPAPPTRGTTAPSPDGGSRAVGLDRLVRDLRRLGREYRALDAAGLPDSAGRLHDVGLRYDSTLAQCCAALGLPAPGPPPLDGVVRLEVEASLAQRGLSW